MGWREDGTEGGWEGGRMGGREDGTEGGWDEEGWDGGRMGERMRERQLDGWMEGG